MKAPSSRWPARDPYTLPRDTAITWPSVHTPKHLQSSQLRIQKEATSCTLRHQHSSRAPPGPAVLQRTCGQEGRTQTDPSWVPSFLPGSVPKQNTLQGNDGERCESPCEHVYCTSLPETEAPGHSAATTTRASAQFSRPVVRSACAVPATAKRGRVSQDPTWSLAVPEGLSGETRPCSASWSLWGHYAPGSSKRV